MLLNHFPSTQVKMLISQILLACAMGYAVRKLLKKVTIFQKEPQSSSSTDAAAVLVFQGERKIEPIKHKVATTVCIFIPCFCRTSSTSQELLLFIRHVIHTPCFHNSHWIVCRQAPLSFQELLEIFIETHHFSICCFLICFKCIIYDSWNTKHKKYCFITSHLAASNQSSEIKL